MIKELTNIEPNNTTVINDVETPYVEKIGDILHFYIGISASSLCFVRLSCNDDYDTYGTCSLEQLTRQQNMYAIHLSMPEFTDQHSSLDFRLSEFHASATTCVEELSKSTDFTIKQWMCTSPEPIVYWAAPEYVEYNRYGYPNAYQQSSAYVNIEVKSNNLGFFDTIRNTQVFNGLQGNSAGRTWTQSSTIEVSQQLTQDGYFKAKLNVLLDSVIPGHYRLDIYNNDNEKISELQIEVCLPHDIYNLKYGESEAPVLALYDEGFGGNQLINKESAEYSNGIYINGTDSSPSPGQPIHWYRDDNGTDVLLNGDTGPSHGDTYSIYYLGASTNPNNERVTGAGYFVKIQIGGEWLRSYPYQIMPPISH